MNITGSGKEWELIEKECKIIDKHFEEIKSDIQEQKVGMFGASFFSFWFVGYFTNPVCGVFFGIFLWVFLTNNYCKNK